MREPHGADSGISGVGAGKRPRIRPKADPGTGERGGWHGTGNKEEDVEVERCRRLLKEMESASGGCAICHSGYVI